MRRVLVTGGLGYIGSHIVVELQKNNFEVFIIDNLSNSSKKVLDGIFEITGLMPFFKNIDLKDKLSVVDFLNKYSDFDGIIHLASSKAVSESVSNPMQGLCIGFVAYLKPCCISGALSNIGCLLGIWSLHDG